jgi:glycosyltransferase involved in cell wall biosynthesis
MRFDPALPQREVVDGVVIERVNVLLRISKGCIAPAMGMMVQRLIKEHDVVHLHLPQFDAAGVALRARLFRKPCVITYHCDLQLAPSAFNLVVNAVVDVMNNVAALAAHRVVTYTQDYGDHSPYLSRYRHKREIILPPVDLPRVHDQEVQEYQAVFNPRRHRPVIAMAARLAAEKGVEVLLDALPQLLEKYPDALVVFAGQYQNVLSEEAYAARVLPRIEPLIAAGRWAWLGILPPVKMAQLFRSIDLLVVPSLNSTESFGLVQIEAMMSGVPVVASNLPGVRQPVLTSGMGQIAEVGDSADLARAMLEVLGNREKYQRNPEEIREQYAASRCAAAYEALFIKIRAELDSRS